MGYIREPKNVDLVVSPSTFTDQTKSQIADAIARYKQTGQKPVSLAVRARESAKIGDGKVASKTKKIK